LTQNKKFKFLVVAILQYLFVFLAVIIPVALVVPKNQSTTIAQTPAILACGTTLKREADYRGTSNVTEAGIPCQPWASQFPNSHAFTAEDFPDADLPKTIVSH
jgi:hypothetical protein